MRRSRRPALGLAVLLAAILMLSAGCSYQLLASNLSLPHSWTSKYWRSRDSAQRTITVDGEGSCGIDVSVTTNSGDLRVDIEDRDGNRMYSGREIPTSSFFVEVPQGEYVIRVVTNGHSGGYAFTWGETEE